MASLETAGWTFSMPLTAIQINWLFEDLEKLGWQRRDGFLFAPDDSMFLSLLGPWEGDLVDFHSRMTGRLERIHQQRATFSEIQFPQIVSDVTGLVQVLQQLILNEAEAT